MSEQSNVINFRKSKPAPAVQLPMIVWAVAGLIIAIFGGLQLAGPTAQSVAVNDFAFIPARFGPAPFEQVIGAKWWSLLTYGFLHASWSHVLLNSLWLAVFSKPVQTYFGNLRYLLILATGIVAGALSTLLVHWGDPMILVGISAGVSALLAASIPLTYGRGRVLRPSELISNRSALIFSLVWLAMTFFTGASQFISNSFVPATNIAWEAHLGGFFAGLIIFYLLEATRSNSLKPTLH